MSKVSAMQAMREARYSARPSVKPAVQPSPVRGAAAAAPASPDAAASPDTAVIPDAAVIPDTAVITEVAGPTAAAMSPVVSATIDEPELALLPADVLRVGRADQPSAADLDEPVAEALCGHRSMNNRNCRRPAGHPEKNHRYN